MPPQYIILRQVGPKLTEVVLYDSDKQTREPLFVGGRWDARRFLRDYRNQPAFENVPAFCEKAGRNGHPGRCAEIPHGML